MTDTRKWTVGGRARCENPDCEWTTEGKNAMANAAQHTQRDGHAVEGELDTAFRVTP